ncbi:MAG: hypothetical protein AAGD25_19400 [Cyanobacteria bacterium P01_F01_bin.150]
MNTALATLSLKTLIEQETEQDGTVPTVYVSIDDSTTGKDKDTTALEGGVFAWRDRLSSFILILPERFRDALETPIFLK